MINDLNTNSKVADVKAMSEAEAQVLAAHLGDQLHAIVSNASIEANKVCGPYGLRVRIHFEIQEPNKE